MRVLLDTHIILWSLANDPKLSQNKLLLAYDMSNIVYV